MSISYIRRHPSDKSIRNNKHRKRVSRRQRFSVKAPFSFIVCLIDQRLVEIAQFPRCNRLWIDMAQFRDPSVAFGSSVPYATDVQKTHFFTKIEPGLFRDSCCERVSVTSYSDPRFQTQALNPVHHEVSPYQNDVSEGGRQMAACSQDRRAQLTASGCASSDSRDNVNFFNQQNNGTP